MTFLSKIYLDIDYLNPFDDPADVVSIDDQIAGGVDLAIAGLSIFLTIVALKTYKTTKLPQLKFVIAAFSLFTTFLLVEAIQEFLPIDDDAFDLLLSVILLAILISFFFGIIHKRKKPNTQ